jgi:hypothetical protein
MFSPAAYRTRQAWMDEALTCAELPADVPQGQSGPRLIAFSGSACQPPCSRLMSDDPGPFEVNGHT